jgi:hypothetical protein
VNGGGGGGEHYSSLVTTVTHQGSILWNSISAETFSHKNLSTNYGQIFIQK